MSGKSTSHTPRTGIEIPEELIEQAVEWGR